MIDIHSHILFGVDDGSESIEQSIEMLKNMASQGITDVILTPHFKQQYIKTPNELKEAFDILKKKIEESGLNINIYLGQEINDQMGSLKLLQQNAVLTLNNSKYVLIEFSRSKYSDIPETIYELTLAGYIPIIAHLERYEYLSMADVEDIKSMGGLIQINADALLGNKGSYYRKVTKALMDRDCVDFIANDYHFMRELDMQEAYKWVKKKYGNERAEKLFNLNAKKIIEG